MFETIYTILTRLATSGDADWSVNGNAFRVDLNDFDGFDDDWSEIDREYEDPDMVEALMEVLDQANDSDGGFYETFFFDDCTLKLGYTSYDI